MRHALSKWVASPTQVQYLYAMAAWYNNLKLTLTGTVRGCQLDVRTCSALAWRLCISLG